MSSVLNLSATYAPGSHLTSTAPAATSQSETTLEMPTVDQRLDVTLPLTYRESAAKSSATGLTQLRRL
ncbi:hypothetical protein N7492_001949 [Penicillium capsulatum]|uniref:Uncharacterized protein n=1 Tax=Penicillium capsulatum TaxID=69766 RepID=A0A9W9IGY1_9EURO|nr:hypothetical protein N7492_001949 [Penicillium capsulatum]